MGEDGEDGSSYYDGVTGETEYYSSEYESEAGDEDAGVDRRRKVKPPSFPNPNDDESNDEEV